MTYHAQLSFLFSFQACLRAKGDLPFLSILKKIKKYFPTFLHPNPSSPLSSVLLHYCFLDVCSVFHLYPSCREDDLCQLGQFALCISSTSFLLFPGLFQASESSAHPQCGINSQSLVRCHNTQLLIVKYQGLTTITCGVNLS